MHCFTAASELKQVVQKGTWPSRTGSTPGKGKKGAGPTPQVQSCATWSSCLHVLIILPPQQQPKLRPLRQQASLWVYFRQKWKISQSDLTNSVISEDFSLCEEWTECYFWALDYYWDGKELVFLLTWLFPKRSKIPSKFPRCVHITFLLWFDYTGTGLRMCEYACLWLNVALNVHVYGDLLKVQSATWSKWHIWNTTKTVFLHGDAYLLLERGPAPIPNLQLLCELLLW